MRDEHSVSEVGETLYRHCENRLVVLHNQDRLTTIRASQREQGSPFALNRPLGRLRQVQLDRGTDADLAVYLDMPSRLLGEPVNLRQPKPGTLAGIPGGEEWLEDMGQR